MVEFINLLNGTFKGPRLPDASHIGTTNSLIRLTNEVQRQASMIGYINAFYLIAVTAAVAMPLVRLMHNRPMEH